MKWKVLLIFFLLIASSIVRSQSGFSFPPGVDKIEIPFQSTFNLIVVPVQINGVELNMILDTGASKSIIFNFKGIDSLAVQKGNLIKVGGYGSRDLFNAYYSEGNIIKLNTLTATNRDLFIAADREVNLEPTMGLVIHGLLGVNFFENALLHIDYEQNNLEIYNATAFPKKVIRNTTAISIRMDNGKPYLFGEVNNEIEVKSLPLLLDTGSGDALWLLDANNDYPINNKSFEDYLGIGMNGEIYGERSKLSSLSLRGFLINSITVSKPHIDNYNRNNKGLIDEGSIGGELLRRFDVYIDFLNKMLYLRPNSRLEEGFYYNMAGVEVQAGDTDLMVVIENKNESVDGYYLSNKSQVQISSRANKLNYIKVPRITVTYVREDSPAFQAGIQVGDEIIAINNEVKGKMTLSDVASKFYKEPYSRVKIKIKRGEEILKFTIKLIPVI